MHMRKFCWLFVLFATVVMAANLVWALGLELGETKEQLKLQYEVTSQGHDTDRVTVDLTISDEGRLKPLSSVNLVIPSEDGTGSADLVVSLATSDGDGKQRVSVHMKREWAERAAFQLRTASLDGKKEPRTWYYHMIPLADYIKNDAPKKE